MGIEIEEFQPLESPRAEIGVENVKVGDSRFTDNYDRPQIAFFCTFKALKGCGARDGETFKQFLNIAYGENEDDLKLRPNTLAGQVIFAALRGEIDPDDGADELAERLKGKRFVGQIGTNKSGEYSRVKHDTVSPAPEPRRGPEPEPEPPEDDPDDDMFNDIPF